MKSREDAIHNTYDVEQIGVMEIKKTKKILKRQFRYFCFFFSDCKAKKTLNKTDLNIKPMIFFVPSYINFPVELTAM